MGKIGRNRKGRGHAAQKTNWKPAVVTHEVRYQIIKSKSKSGVEHVKYRPVVMPRQP